MNTLSVCSASAVLLLGAGAGYADTDVDMALVLDQLRRDATGNAGESNFLGLEAEWYQAPTWLDHGYVDLWTMRLYALFDGDDAGVLAVYGLEGVPLSVTSFSGTFYNDGLGADTAPIDTRSLDYWSNQWDTYLTINADDAEGDVTDIADISGLSTSFSTTNGGWFVTPADSQQMARDGRVLLTQMTVACDGGGISGVINLLFSNTAQIEGLDFVFQPTALREGNPTQAGGTDCNQNCIDDVLDTGLNYSRDCNGNGMPDECESTPCSAADFDCSGSADFADVLFVLAEWGPCGVCDQDIDLDRMIGFAEVLEILANFGPCPQ